MPRVRSKSSERSPTATALSSMYLRGPCLTALPKRMASAKFSPPPSDTRSLSQGPPFPTGKGRSQSSPSPPSRRKEAGRTRCGMAASTPFCEGEVRLEDTPRGMGDGVADGRARCAMRSSSPSTATHSSSESASKSSSSSSLDFSYRSDVLPCFHACLSASDSRSALRSAATKASCVTGAMISVPSLLTHSWPITSGRDKRFAGFLHSMRTRRLRKAGSSLVAPTEHFSGNVSSFCTTMRASSGQVGAIQGGWPTTSMYKVAPTLHTSTRGSSGAGPASARSSGAMKAGVPFGTAVALPSAMARATPKSAIFTVSSFVTRRLAGLMSRCTIPMRCRYSTPRRISRRYLRARSGGSGALILVFDPISPFSAYS
mmetsp:Transcript_9485/g.21710  ORF Transcript_9485/g.21710 Transcript_9485/m.21710 type:complete len:372 (-) Transcript_9485:1523-2638(-)